MTATAERRDTTFAPRKTLGQQVVRVLTTTDHKLIGKLYLGTSFAWFLIGGLMALFIRAELAFPGSQVVSQADYDSYLKDLEAQGNVADEPLLGGEDARTQAGLEDAQTETGGTE